MRMKNIALIAHDNCKADLMDWAGWNAEFLAVHNLICTGTTGRLVKERLEIELKRAVDNVFAVKSGPLGGDLQIGAMICEDKIDLMIFFWDPLTQQPHDSDVKALLRISSVYNLPVAQNRSSADFLISSKLLKRDYFPERKNFDSYTGRVIPCVKDVG
ncbi:MAG: methylglyoxal synthase [Spirochaetales bacterium]|nr:methylglyoxal synthase [Spirochaetales bacterium]